MVGSTILESGCDDLIRFRGGLHWQTLAARGTAIGLHDKLGDSFDLRATEEALDATSGASTYATRHCIERIDFIDDSYFLYFEDLDWGARAKELGLGMRANRSWRIDAERRPGQPERYAIHQDCLFTWNTEMRSILSASTSRGHCRSALLCRLSTRLAFSCAVQTSRRLWKDSSRGCEERPGNRLVPKCTAGITGTALHRCLQGSCPNFP